MTTADEELLSLSEVARELGRPLSTLNTWARKGLLQATQTPRHGRSVWRIARSEVERLRTHPPLSQRGRAPLADAALRTAITALREGLTSDQAGERAGMTGRGLRKRLAALGLRESELRPPAADPPPLGPHERRRRLHALARERQWERERATGTTAYSRQHAERRRDLHLLLTPAAWEAVHAEAERRQCSMSSLVADALYALGIIPEP
jgi:hypothetical protein